MKKNMLAGTIMTFHPAGVHDLDIREGVKRFGNCTIVTTRLEVSNPPRRATPIAKPETDDATA